MQHVTDRMLADAINSLDKQTFDTHDVERRVLRDEPVAVARQILEHEGQQDVLRQFSASFSSRIANAFPGQIDKTNRKVTSPNLGWRESANQEWRRVDMIEPVTAP